MIPQSPSPGPPPDPERPVTEADRDVIVQQLQHALADGRIEFEELDDRFALVYAATNRGELDRATADLPVPPAPPPAPAYHPAPPSTFSLLGDVKIGGWLGGGGPIAATTIVGDVVIDVTTMAVDDGIRVSARSGLGDITVIVPDGVFVRVSATTLIGDRKEKLVPPRHGAPTVEIDALSFLGDVKVYSLSRTPKGKLRKLWKQLHA